MNYARYLTPISSARKPSPIRVLTALLAQSPPSMISLAGGQPNPKLFPFKEADILLRDGTKLKFDEPTMETALQYGPTQGQATFVKWLKKMQADLHNPPTLNKKPEEGGMDMCVTTGSQDGICKSLEMMVDPGDNVVIDSPTYPGTLGILRPLGCNLLPVETDHLGMIPGSLAEVMSRWSPQDVTKPETKIPKVMYTIPNGVNPTGACISTERKHEIYQIARKFDMLILEDDPYYFLQFKERAPSFLSMDVDGRVLRYDSFSKILSSGLRVGFTTGPQPLINKIQMHMMVSVMHTSSMSQVMCSELLYHWGLKGFLEHVDNVVEFYRSQKDALMVAADKHLTGLAEWHEPQAGMFLWMKLKGINDTKKLIEEKAVEKEVMLVPGCAFMPDPDVPSPYVRAAFSLATPEQMDLAFERLAALIKEEVASQK